MKRLFRHLAHREKAQAMVEFALVIPVLLLLVYGIMEFGRLLFIYSSVTTASREAARYGSAVGTVAGVPRYADCAGILTAAQRGSILLPITAADITINYDDGSGNSVAASCAAVQGVQIDLGDRINVTIRVVYAPIFPIVNFASFPITSVTSRTIVKRIDIEGTPAPGGGSSAPTAYFEVDHASLTEGVSPTSFTLNVRLTGNAFTNIYVPLTIAGSAIQGSDYTLSTTCDPTCSVMIAAGTSSTSITIHVIDDTLYEDPEDVTIAMGTPSGGVHQGDPHFFTLTINDNDPPPTVYFSAATSSVQEGGTTSIAVVLSNASGKDVHVSYSYGISTDTAALGVDFNAPTPASPILIPAGTIGRAIVVQTLSDNMYGVDKQVTFTLSNPVHADLGSPVTHVLTIAENDSKPLISFNLANINVQRGTSPVIFVRLDKPSLLDAKVTLTRSGTAIYGTGTGTPENPIDYSTTPPCDPNCVITVPAGSTSVGFTFNTNNYIGVEGATATFSMGSYENADPGPITTHTATLKNTETPPEINFFMGSLSHDVLEGQSLTILAVSDNPAWPYAVTVNFTASGTAVCGATKDYTINGGLCPASYSVTIPPNSSSASIIISTYNDNMWGDNLTLNINMTSVSDETGQAAKGTLETFEDIIILEASTQPYVNFNPVNYSGGENESARIVVISFHLTADIDGYTPVMSTKPVAISFSFSSSSGPSDAILCVGPGSPANCDYSASASAATIPAKSSTGTIILTIVDDNLPENTESATISISTVTDGMIGNNSYATVSILDNDQYECPQMTAYSSNILLTTDKLSYPELDFWMKATQVISITNLVITSEGGSLGSPQNLNFTTWTGGSTPTSPAFNCPGSGGSCTTIPTMPTNLSFAWDASQSRYHGYLTFQFKFPFKKTLTAGDKIMISVLFKNHSLVCSSIVWEGFLW